MTHPSTVQPFGHPEDRHAYHDGCMVSVQSVLLPYDAALLEVWGSERGLRFLVRAYFRVAADIGGPCDVGWEGDAPIPRVRLLHIPMIRMGQPRYVLEPARRAAELPILGGALLDASRLAGARFVFALELAGESTVRLSVELIGYAPRGGSTPVGGWLYRLTQAKLHELIGKLFLRQAARAWQKGRR